MVFTGYAYIKNLQWTNYSILLSILFLGIFIYQTKEYPLPNNHIYYEKPNNNLKIIGYVTDEPLKKYYKRVELIKFVAEIEGIIKNNEIDRRIGKIIVFFKKWNKDSTPPISYGDKVLLIGRLDEPLPQRNPYSFSYKDYLARFSIFNIFYAREIKVSDKEAKYDFIKKNAIKLKNRYLEVFNETISNKVYSQLLGSLIFGDRASPLPEYLMKEFRATGVVHILVASGAQVAIFLALCVLLMQINIKQNIIYSTLIIALTIFIIIFYAHMTGMPPSIIRAGIMGVVFIISIFLQREYDAMNSLAFACFLMLIVEPSYIYDVGFQLSFAACIGIIYINPRLFNLLKVYTIKSFERLSYFVLLLISACISAQVMVLPLIGYYFNNFSAIAFISNIFIVPLAIILLPLGLIIGLLGMTNLTIASILNSFSEFLLALIVNLNHLFYIVPYSCNTVKSPSILTIIIYYLSIFAFTNYQYFERVYQYFKRVRKESLLIVILVIVTSIIWVKVLTPQDKTLKVIFFDVSHGDCILISKGNHHMVIDGGRYEEEKGYTTALTNYLIKKGIKKLDYVILTHPHRDHIEGLIPVLENFKVKYVISADWGKELEYEDEIYSRFEELIEKNDIELLDPLTTKKRRYFTNAIYFDILHPQEEFLRGTSSDIDNNSIVIRLVYNDINFLFTGDIFSEVEDRLLNSPIESNILKVAHHGSNSSSTMNFLEKVSPEIAIISADRYSEKHPHPEVVERLKELNTKIYCTANNGAIIITTDGKSYNVETMIE